MPYTASIDRSNPGCLLFLVDQSRSMAQSLAGQRDQSKMAAAADAVNRVVDNIAQRCSQGMEVRDYFHIGILGYGNARALTYEEVISGDYIYTIAESEERTGYTKEAGKYNPQVDGPIHEESIISVFPETGPEWPFVSISEVINVAKLEERQVREHDSDGRIVELTRQMPVWLQPHAGMETPMCQGLAHAFSAVEAWISQHPDSFPPIVINISDGEATDGDPEPFAREIMGLRSNDGNALVFNCHLSGDSAIPIQYPDDESGLPDDHARKMFRMSSLMPGSCLEYASRLGISTSAESRCCVFNADLVTLVQFLDIGTRGPSSLN